MRSSSKNPKRKRPPAAAPVVEDTVVPAPAAPATDSAPTAPTVALAANCTVKDSAALKASLCAVADVNESVVLDAGGVERIDTATVQLLCAFVRDRAGRNQSVAWQHASSALLEAARLLGVQSLLALPANTTGAAA